jgi:hypothetical protein
MLVVEDGLAVAFFLDDAIAQLAVLAAAHVEVRRDEHLLGVQVRFEDSDVERGTDVHGIRAFLFRFGLKAGDVMRRRARKGVECRLADEGLGGVVRGFRQIVKDGLAWPWIGPRWHFD